MKILKKVEIYSWFIYFWKNIKIKSKIEINEKNIHNKDRRILLIFFQNLIENMQINKYIYILKKYIYNFC